MSWQATPYTLVQAAVAAALVMSAGYALYRRRLPAARMAALLALACAWWVAASALMLASVGTATKMVWLRLELMAIAVLPALWLAYTLVYTRGAQWLTARRIALLAVEPVLFVALVWTNEWHGWIWRRAGTQVQAGLQTLVFDYGPGLWLHAALAALVVAMAAAVWIQADRYSARLYRRQSWALLGATLLVLWIAVGVLAGLHWFTPLDPLPMASGLTVLLAGWSLAALRRKDIVPAARATAVHGMSDAVLVLDARQRVVDANPAAQALLGAVQGRPIQVAWPGWSVPLEPAGAAAEIVLDGKDRQVFDLMLSPLTDWRGRLAGWVAVARDVTRRRAAEEALHDSEARYRAVLEQSIDNIYLMDVETCRVIEANPALHAFLGYAPGELHGLPIHTFIDHPLEDIHDKLRQVLEQGHLFMGERHYRRLDGSMVAVEVSGSLIHDRGKQALCIVSRDITQRKQAAEALASHNRELQQLNAAARALSASLSIDQVLETLAGQLQQLLQVRACSVWLVAPGEEELICRAASCPNPARLLGSRARVGHGLLGWVALSGASMAVPDTQLNPEVILEWTQPTGMTPRSVLAVPLLIKQDVLGVLEAHDCLPGAFEPKDLALAESLAASAAVAIDNARLYEDLKRRMEELRRTQANLVQAAKMAAFGELAAGVAHELNNPLTPIMGFAELMLEKPSLPDWARKNLAIIVRESKRARSIVQNLLEFAGQGGRGREPADLNVVLHETLSLVGTQLVQKGIDIQEQYAAGLPPLMLDVSRTKQAILNLVANAALAMPQGGRLLVTSERSDGGVAVRIADSGLGIPPEKLPRIFEPFYTSRPVGQGTGLGLSVSLGIVREHGGRIGVESECGVGSTFTVWLPLEEQVDADRQ